MRSIHALLAHRTAGPMLRYAIAGAIVGAVYLSLPVLLNSGFGIAIQIAIPVAYVVAVSLHFTLQRHFVWRHVTEFALSARQQIARYLAVGAVQYPATALATLLLPRFLGLSDRATYVCTAIVISLIVFVVLRSHIFHAAADAEQPRREGGKARARELV
jgi:putative flippase GtrA